MNTPFERAQFAKVTAIDASKAVFDSAQTLYREIASRVEAALDEVKRFADDLAVQFEAAVEDRKQAARAGLVPALGRIPQRIRPNETQPSN